MAVRTILTWPDARLNMAASPVTADDSARRLAQDMLDTMYAAYGRGLAATQIGQLSRVFVMDALWKTGDKAPEVFLNPEIIWRSDSITIGPEGCLSIPGTVADVARASEIILRWTTGDGAIAAQKLVGFRAICAQHEIDHLDGILTLDRLSPQDRARAEAAVGA